MSLSLAYLEIPGDEEDDNTKVRGVRIACEGEVKELDVPKFQPASIPVFDEIFRDEENVPNLSRFIGIPLAVRKIPVDDYLNMDKSNVEAASMFRNCDLSSAETNDSGNPSARKNPPSANPPGARSASSHSSASGTGGPSNRGGSSRGGRAGGSIRREARYPDLPVFNGFGGIPAAWDPVTVGPVLAVRQDRKPLHVLHAEAIAAFLTNTLRRPFAELVEAEQRRAWHHGLMMAGTGVTDPQAAAAAWVSEPDVFERRRNLLGQASAAKFAEFYEEYKAQRVAGRPDLLEAVDDEERAERWSVLIEEMEPKPEWNDVPSPFDI